MKTKLEFEFDESEQDDVQTVIGAWKYRSALEAVYQDVFRNPLKYGFAEELKEWDNESSREFLEALRARFFMVLDDNDVELP